MSILGKLFGAVPPAAQTTQPQTTQAGAGQPGNMPQPNQNTAVSAGTAPNGAVPEGSAAGTQQVSGANAGGANTSPLDQFNSLWEPNATPQETAPLINVDPKSLAEAAKRTDFTKMVTPEQMQAISAGGEQAMQAMIATMNQVAQGVYAQSAFATTKIVEQAVAKAQERFSSEIPAHVKRLQVSESLRSENPALNHPAASPILGAIEAQLTQKHPNASSTELRTMAQQYLENFASVIQAPAAAAAAEKLSQANKGKETDWSAYLS